MSFNLNLEQVCLDHPESCKGTCFANGTCGMCPPGWVHETLFQRFENCAQPEVFITVISSVVLISTFCLGIPIIGALRTAKGDVKLTLAFTLLGDVALFIAFAILIAFQYGHPAHFIFVVLGITGVCSAYINNVYVYTRVSYNIYLKSRYPRKLALVMGANFVLLGVLPFVVILIPASFQNGKLFNTMVAIALLINLSNLILSVPLLHLASRAILVEIDKLMLRISRDDQQNSPREQAGKELIGRIRQFRNALLFGVPFQILSFGGLSIGYFFWKLPYYGWIFYMQLVSFLFILYILLTSSQSSGKSSSSKAHRSITELVKKSSKDSLALRATNDA